jgi:hypothetical protein
VTSKVEIEKEMNDRVYGWFGSVNPPYGWNKETHEWNIESIRHGSHKEDQRVREMKVEHHTKRKNFKKNLILLAYIIVRLYPINDANVRRAIAELCELANPRRTLKKPNIMDTLD